MVLFLTFSSMCCSKNDQASQKKATEQVISQNNAKINQSVKEFSEKYDAVELTDNEDCLQIGKVLVLDDILVYKTVGDIIIGFAKATGYRGRYKFLMKTDKNQLYAIKHVKTSQTIVYVVKVNNHKYSSENEIEIAPPVINSELIDYKIIDLIPLP